MSRYTIKQKLVDTFSFTDDDLFESFPETKQMDGEERMEYIYGMLEEMDFESVGLNIQNSCFGSDDRELSVENDSFGSIISTS